MRIPYPLDKVIVYSARFINFQLIKARLLKERNNLFRVTYQDVERIINQSDNAGLHSKSEMGKGNVQGCAGRHRL